MTNYHTEEEIQQISIHIRTLVNDVELSINHLNNSDDKDYDYYARIYIRAYAAWIEGIIWLYKETIRKTEHQWHKNLALSSQLFLFEYDWTIEHSGQPKIRQKKIRTQDNLKGLFFVMHEIFPDFSYSLSKGGWEDIVLFYQIRDRVMHPVNSDSLKINKKDIKKCESGRIWLQQQFLNLNKSITNKISSEINNKSGL